MGNVYVITGRTDMRKSFDSLILLIQDTYQLDPYSKSVFLFCGRDTSKLKALYHDRGRVGPDAQKAGWGRTLPVAAFPIRGKADYAPAAPVAPGGAVPGPAKSNQGNRKEKRYLMFVQNRESEKNFLLPCRTEKIVIH